MRLILTIVLPLFIIACSTNQKEQKEEGFKIRVWDKNDTLTSISFKAHEKYSFYDSSGVDTLFSDKFTLTKIQGRFKFGIKDRKGSSNMFLFFQKTSDHDLEFSKETHTPFLKEALLVNSEYNVSLYEDFIDSISNPVHKYETYAAIDKMTKDTILFQEVSYMIHEKNMIIKLLIYNDKNTRDEMTDVMNDAIQTINKSINEARQRTN